MARGIITRKLGMTRLFDDAGNSIPVTVLQAGPCRVTQVKTAEKDGYSAVQLGFHESKPQRLTKPEVGHQKGAKQPMRHLREFRDMGDYEVGQEVKADLFEAGALVKVTGVSKGKGFQGVVKRYNFGGGRKTHGSGFYRAPGSLNASAYPSRVFKGKKLPGHMGQDTVTVRNLKVVHADPEQNLLFIRGSIPGARTTIVFVEAQ